MGSVSRRAFMLRMNTVLGFITVLYVDIVTLLLFLFRDSVGLSPTAPPPPKKKKKTRWLMAPITRFQIFVNLELTNKLVSATSRASRTGRDHQGLHGAVVGARGS